MSDDISPQTDPAEPDPIGLAGLAPVETLGQQWAAQAQQMAARRVPARPWLHALAPVLGRLAALPAPDTARFQRVELGAEPLPAAPRVRPAPEDAQTVGAGYVAGIGKSSDVASIEEHTLRAPNVRPPDTIRPSVSSVAGPVVKPAGDMDARAAEAPALQGTRARDTIRPSVSSVTGPTVRPAEDIDARAAQAPVSPGTRPRDTIRSSVSSVGGPGVKPAGDMDARAAEAPVSPGTRVRDTIRSSVSSVAGPAAETAGNKDTRPEGAPVSPDVHLRLRDLVGPAIPAMRVRDDIRADAAARSRQADAVTVGNQVLFRADQYRPYTPRGLALLAHEAVHAAEAQQPNVAWQRATAAGRADEERQALAVERATLHSVQGAPASAGRKSAAPGAPSPPRDVLPGPAAAASRTAWSLPALPASEGAGSQAAAGLPMTAAMHPMAAAAGRDLQEEPAPATPAPSFQELREALYRDLMRQLRADFERGG